MCRILTEGTHRINTPCRKSNMMSIMKLGQRIDKTAKLSLGFIIHVVKTYGKMYGQSQAYFTCELEENIASSHFNPEGSPDTQTMRLDDAEPTRTRFQTRKSVPLSETKPPILIFILTELPRIPKEIWRKEKIKRISNKTFECRNFDFLARTGHRARLEYSLQNHESKMGCFVHYSCSLIFFFFVYLFIRFACISYRRFIAIRCQFRPSTYVQIQLVIGRRGCVQRET